jgi:hypothetical protein
MGDSLGDSLTDLKTGIEDAKKAAKSTADTPTDDQMTQSDYVIDVMAADLTDAIHAYTQSAKVITKSDVMSPMNSTDPETSATGITAEDGAAEGEGQGGIDKGLTGLDGEPFDTLYADIKNAYTTHRDAAFTEVQDTEMSLDDKKAGIEMLIYNTLADLFCSAVYDYVTKAKVETDVTVLGGVDVAGGIHTQDTSTASGVAQAATGTTEEYADATGTGVGDKGVS